MVDVLTGTSLPGINSWELEVDELLLKEDEELEDIIELLEEFSELVLLKVDEELLDEEDEVTSWPLRTQRT
jgi:hypothetical protein